MQANGAAQNIDYRHFRIQPYPRGASFLARIRRIDGQAMTVGCYQKTYFDTLECPTPEEAIRLARLALDSGGIG